MTTATLSPTRDYLFPAAATALAAVAWGMLTGAVPTELLAAPPMPAVLCCTIFGSFAAIALAQRPRPAATPQVIIKVTSERPAGQATNATSPGVVQPPVKKAA